MKLSRIYIVTPETLLEVARQAATDSALWAEHLVCNVDDYVKAGLRGRSTTIPIPKLLNGTPEALGRFTHLLSRERTEEDARDWRRNRHFVELTPEPAFTLGRLGVVEVTPPARDIPGVDFISLDEPAPAGVFFGIERSKTPKETP